MDGIIFDVDGTIWDSTESVAEAWTMAIQEKTGDPRVLTAELMKRLFGKTVPEIAAVIFDGLDLTEEEAGRLMDHCTLLENKHLREKPGKVYDGVEELLDQLSKKYPLYIVSNCDFGYIEAMLDGTGFGKYFQDHMCYADTQQPKEVNIRLMAEKHGLKKPVYIGDTQGDLNSCRKAGVPMIHVTYGLGTADEPEYSADSTEEVARILL